MAEICELNFAYDKRPVLQGINMVFPKGKLIAIMGLSGCGKTTLLRHIGGALKPTKGCVKGPGVACASETPGATGGAGKATVPETRPCDWS